MQQWNCLNDSLGTPTSEAASDLELQEEVLGCLTYTTDRAALILLDDHNEFYRVRKSVSGQTPISAGWL